MSNAVRTYGYRKASTGTPKWHADKASQAQLDTIAKNLDRKQITQVVLDGLTAQLAEGVNKGQASAIIDYLFTLPWKPRETTPEQAQVAEAKAQLTTGYYIAPNDTIIKVVQNKTNPNLSGRRLVGTTWKYQGRDEGIDLLAEAAAGRLVTIEEAAKFGHENHICLICGAKLDENQLGEHASAGVKLSVKRGIGPTCYKRLMLQDPAFAARQAGSAA